MKKIIRSMTTIFILVMVVILLGVVSPVFAAIDIFVTDTIFLTAERDFYGEAITDLLREQNSPLADYQENISGVQTTTGDMIWLGSQHMDFGINPKVLIVNLKVLGMLETLPASRLLPFVQEMAEKLWGSYIAYQDGVRTVFLGNQTEFEIGPSNGATYALANFFAEKLNSEDEVVAKLKLWRTAYQALFGVNPGYESIAMMHAVPVVEPFLELPFKQPAENFIGVTSFFDHAVPGNFDDSILRFDGKTLRNASFSGCTLGTNCYGGHNAIDYRTGAGMPMLAAADGVVVYKYFNTDPSAGRVDSGVYIDHGNGYRTAYWHMDPILIDYGQTVSAGDVIGLSGNIGMSSGPHLHFGLRLVDQNKPVDPFGWWSSSVGDYWGDSYWMWKGDLVADNDEAQAQLFFIFYWWRDTRGYGGESYWTYAVSSPESSTNWGVWGTQITSPGQYNVYAYWPKDSQNTKKARYEVFHADGSTIVQVDQSASGDQFVKLGTFNFERGDAAVLLTDYTGESGKRVVFDAVKWEPATNNPTPVPLGSGTYDDTDTRIQYRGNWILDTTNSAYQGTRHFSAAPGNSITLDFFGRQVGLLYTGDSDRGLMDVYIDGVLTESVDQQTGSISWQVEWLSLPVSLGWHTLTLSHASGSLVDLDAVKIYETVQNGTPGEPDRTKTPTPTRTSTPKPKVNLALGKAATQSSNFGSDINLVRASNAVDGNTSGIYWDGTLTHTLKETRPWWQVDLGKVEDIAQISVWNRADCCGERLSDFYVLVSDLPFNSTNLDTVRNQSGVSAYIINGQGGRPTVLNINRSGRYVRVQLTGTNYLSLAEVEVWSAGGAPVPSTRTPTSTITSTPTPTHTKTATATSTKTNTPKPQLVNVAQGKPASQSSTFGSDSTKSRASNAVDGNTSGIYWDGTLTHTNKETQPWWQVDLGKVEDITKINVWNRSDCCGERLSDFYVLVSDVPFSSTNLDAVRGQAGVSAFYVSGQGGRPTVVDVNRSGRYIRVQLSGNNYLTLSEVEVLAGSFQPNPPTKTPTITRTNTPTVTEEAQVPTDTSTPTSTRTNTPTASKTPTPTSTNTPIQQHVNVALGKLASQSSTFGSDVTKSQASNAVDGNTSGIYWDNTLTHTLMETRPWWQVDLGSVEEITEITVWNRTDCCGERLSDFYVLVSDVPFNSTNLDVVRGQAGVSAYHVGGQGGRPTIVDVNRSGRYIRVQLNGTNYLSLAEVEVWTGGVPPSPQTKTPTPSKTLTPTATRTPTISTGNITYELQASPVYIPNFSHPEAGNNWLGVAGQVFSASGLPVNHIVVVVEGTLGGNPIDALSLTGLYNSYGPGGYEIVLGDSPVDSNNTLSIRLYSLDGTALSDPYFFRTYNDPLRNLILINFQER